MLPVVPTPDSKNVPNTELLGLDVTGLATLLTQYGEPAFRARQIFRALYKRHVRHIEEIHELSKAFRARLAAEVCVDNLHLTQVFESNDDTRRYLFKLSSGEAIEAVWIPEAQRATICLSSQAGCPLGCDFCLTAQIGLKRNLTPGEIVGQIVAVLRDERERRQIAGHSENLLPPINLVLMGMGEPLLNYDNVMSAIRLAANEEGLHIRPRHITLSTAGIVPRIYDLGKEPLRPYLAVSLSAPNDELRDQLMPINKRYPLAELIKACLDFPLAPNEQLTFEYVMLNKINDHEEHARQILKLTAPLRARNALKINLIPHNPAPGLNFRPSSEARVTAFQEILKRKEVPVFVRRPRGRDITAACGQLAAVDMAGRHGDKVTG